MSFNRLRYDNCAYTHELKESVGTLAYMLDPSRYENCNKCRMELGIIGGTNVSHIKGNLVDLETDLRGTTRMSSKCPSRKYQNPCPNGDMVNCSPNKIVLQGNGGNQMRTLDTNMVHLPSCQMIRYKPTPLEPSMEPVLCPSEININNTNNSVNNTVNNTVNNVNEVVEEEENTLQNIINSKKENFTAYNSFDNFAAF